ncbi:MAG: hypothetical protein Q7T36_05140 [Fluviicoccus sp.]|uniref:hypothetical protein n=1 Tax=Fluviicoccus sp. TaxID=2003552 RepID=UPI002719B34B|nr:hypothetical protein [Fluviicoccus sp.]MDO8329839.1 hypothetical protein [Fluviicoccus sp.]
MKELIEQTFKSPFIWWSVLLVAISLPLTVSHGIILLGGYFADYMDLNAYRLIVLIVCWAGLLFAVWLLCLPQRFPRLRIAAMIVLSIFLVMISFAPITSLCEPEYVELTRLGELTPAQLADRPVGETEDSCG